MQLAYQHIAIQMGHMLRLLPDKAAAQQTLIDTFGRENVQIDEGKMV